MSVLVGTDNQSELLKLVTFTMHRELNITGLKN